jgi:hypothetical protein
MLRILVKTCLSLVVILPFVNGCGGGGVSISVLPSIEEFQQNTNADVKIDILFVIDDSGSMSQEQQALYDNFKSFIDLFYDKGFDFRVAVAKTSAYGSSIACKEIATGTNRTCSESGAYKYSSGNFISRESGLTPKEFRCGYGNSCGVNSQYQTSQSISGTADPDAPANDPQPLQTTVGNGTPGPATDHILASSNLSRAQMIDKFKKNILVGLAGSGDERALESAETVIRNMKQFYPDPNQQFPRPNSHLAIIHVGDEGDGPMPNDLTEGSLSTALHGSNRSGSSPYTSSTWGSLRSTFINSWSGYDPIVLVTNGNLYIDDHLASAASYLDALKKHDLTTTVSVHAIEDLPNSSNIPFFIPSSPSDSCNSSTNATGSGIGYLQAYLAQLSAGLIFSKCSGFGPSLSALGDTISSLASFFTLGGPLDATAQETLKVYVEGINNNNPVPNSAVNGYQYDSSNNRIRFYGSMIPPQGAIIGLQYTCGSLDPGICYQP